MELRKFDPAGYIGSPSEAAEYLKCAAEGDNLAHFTGALRDVARAFAATPNTSGIIPLDMRVLVKPDPVEEVTKGGIFLPDQVKEQQKYATCKATLVAVGVNAWAEALRSDAFTAPKPGDRVLIAKYGGVNLPGDDGQDYRLLNDEDVVGLLGVEQNV